MNDSSKWEISKAEPPKCHCGCIDCKVHCWNCGEAEPCSNKCREQLEAAWLRERLLNDYDEIPQ